LSADRAAWALQSLICFSKKSTVSSVAKTIKNTQAGALFENALSGYLFRRPTKVEVAPQSGPCRRWMMIDPALLPFRAIVGEGRGASSDVQPRSRFIFDVEINEAAP
jgi:hypothetical protein